MPQNPSPQMILTFQEHFSDVDPLVSNPCLFVQDDLIFFIGQRVFVDLWVQVEEPALSALMIGPSRDQIRH
jgi:hypothetical protein